MQTPELLKQTLCASIEKIINQSLALNSGDAGALQLLNQKTLTVELAELGFPLSVTVHEQQVLVTTLVSASDCTLVTSIKTLVALKNEQQLTQLIKNEQLDITGDIKVAQQFSALAENLHIDWQTELAKHIGDIATYKLVHSGEQLKQKLSFAKQQIESDMGEWIVHEKSLVITKSSINLFSQAVTQVQQDTEVLSARIAKLSQQLQLNYPLKQSLDHLANSAQEGNE